jgi:hypothetical protein
MMMPYLPICSVPTEKEKVNYCRRLGREVKEGLLISLLMDDPNAIIGTTVYLLVAQLIFLSTNEWKRINISNLEKGFLPT